MDSEKPLAQWFERVLLVFAATVLAVIAGVALVQFWLLNQLVVEQSVSKPLLLYLPVVLIILICVPAFVWLVRVLKKELESVEEGLGRASQTQKLYIQQSEHELQRPLTVARANIELLYDNPDFLTQEIGHRKLQTTLRVIDRLSAMIKSFRYLHTVDLNQGLTLKKQPVDFVELIESIIDEYAATVPDHIWVEFDHPHYTKPHLIELDPEAIKQVLLNILDFRLTAIEKADPKSAQITVSAIDSGSFAMIILKDDGPPLNIDALTDDEEHLIANPGLRASHAIVDAHTGSINFVNRASQGSRFVISIPIQSEQVSPLRFEPIRQRFSLGKLVQETVDEYQLKAGDKGIALSAVLLQGSEYGYEGDENSIREALANLIDNAIKYGRDGDQISVQLQDKGGTVIMRILDTGKGIPPAQLATIFDLGYQIDPARAGRGLGLSIVKSIIEAHGGSISASNRPDGGAVFTITLQRFSIIAPQVSSS